MIFELWIYQKVYFSQEMSTYKYGKINRQMWIDHVLKRTIDILSTHKIRFDLANSELRGINHGVHQNYVKMNVFYCFFFFFCRCWWRSCSSSFSSVSSNDIWNGCTWFNNISNWFSCIVAYRWKSIFICCNGTAHFNNDQFKTSK